MVSEPWAAEGMARGASVVEAMRAAFGATVAAVAAKRVLVLTAEAMRVAAEVVAMA